MSHVMSRLMARLFLRIRGQLYKEARMTMGEESLFSSMALPVVIGPILEKLEAKDMAASQTLRAALTKVENQHPGFCIELIRGVLHKAELGNHIDLSETLLRLEGTNDTEEFRIVRPEEPFRHLNHRALALKKILSRIPLEIYDRKKFLETIKDIASAIKNLLDAVNNVFRFIQGQSNKQNLEQKKREFVRYSKKFSNTLKEFFKDNQKQEVFLSANFLINQTNIIMKTIKELC
ncbi:unnamed protein product [Owenia fusiformis]|uniref:Programmed cell death protein 10 dimerisation domain-containing protein n=1 Tax=Owenia fusiformis TaxID=6347 RepID=A0A8S4NP49_OWEFU|nr:unnamed protein product [Owenia fusiformis]